VFTDETYSTRNPLYYLLSSPIFKYNRKDLHKNINNFPISDFNYESPCNSVNGDESLDDLKNQEKPASSTQIPTTTLFSSKTTQLSSSETSNPILTTSIIKQTTVITSTAKKEENYNIMLTKPQEMIPDFKINFNFQTTHSQLINETYQNEESEDRLNELNRSMLINLVAKSNECLNYNTEHFIELMTNKLKKIYRNVSNFEQVVITKITRQE
jgi:hypothetical protein